MTLIDRLETDLAYRTLYSRLLAATSRHIPFKMKAALSFEALVSIEQEVARYRAELKKKIVRSRNTKKILDEQKKAQENESRGLRGSWRQRTKEPLDISRTGANSARHPKDEKRKMGRGLESPGDQAQTVFDDKTLFPIRSKR